MNWSALRRFTILAALGMILTGQTGCAIVKAYQRINESIEKGARQAAQQEEFLRLQEWKVRQQELQYKAAEAGFSAALARANCGNPNSQIFVSNSYENGRGVEKNLVEALNWYTLATSGGNTGTGAELHKELLEGQMTATEIDQAKRLAQEWQPGDC